MFDTGWKSGEYGGLLSQEMNQGYSKQPCRFIVVVESTHLRTELHKSLLEHSVKYRGIYLLTKTIP